jgi:hypothetical protein
LDAAVATFDRDYELLEPLPDETYDVAFIAAPVFDASAEVVLALTLNGLHNVTGRQVVAHAERLGAATRLLTKLNDGRLPPGLATETTDG